MEFIRKVLPELFGIEVCRLIYEVVLRAKGKGRNINAVGAAQVVSRDVRAEMKRVSWPGFHEVRNTTLITLVAVIFFAVYLFAVDQALSRLILGLDWLIEKIARALGLA